MRGRVFVVGLVTAGLVVIGASTGRGANASIDPVLRWVSGRAEAGNGPAPAASALAACGSSTETFLTELTHVAPTQAKVLREWGDIVPGGKQVLISGSVTTTHLGPTDLPTSHVYGDDLSMNVAMDPSFRAFSQQLGQQQGEEVPGSMHVEVASGYIPHVPRPSIASVNETWRQASDQDLSGFQPDFSTPTVGDRTLIMGRWIIDCGHGDYSTELHPMSFLAWAHQRHDTTTVHAYYNPYRDTEQYSPDATILNRVQDTARFAASKPFPPYLVDEVIRLITGQVPQLRSQELLDAPRASPVAWQACAPPGKGAIHVRYDFVARPGVRLRIVRAPHGCVTVHSTLTSSYRPLDPPLRSCLLPWTYLNQIAQGAIGSATDVRQLIKQNVPAQFWPLVDRDPRTTCADPLAGPVLEPRPDGRRIRYDPAQPFPFYGTLTVTRTE